MITQLKPLNLTQHLVKYKISMHVSTFYVLSRSLQFYWYGYTDSKSNRNITKQVYGKFRRELYNASKIRNERCSTYRLKKPCDTSLKLNLSFKNAYFTYSINARKRDFHSSHTWDSETNKVHFLEDVYWSLDMFLLHSCDILEDLYLHSII